MKELSQKDNFADMLIEDDGAAKLLSSWKSREIDQVFPGLLPDKPGREAAMLQEYLKGFYMLPKDRNLRLALFFLCFDEKKALSAAESLDMNADDKLKVMASIRLRQEFHFVDSVYKVKNFLAVYGEPLFQFMQRICEWQVKLHGHAEIRNEARAEYLLIIKKTGEPVYIEDMKIDADKLREIGVEEEKINKSLATLLDFVHKFPHANKEDILLKKAKNVSSGIGMKLLKKFLGKY